ncbi:uncharacterized protein T551_02754 [Pneumocystis jirovecii RU7]|uniref:Protein YIP n=1 Tax=Pneumocystis jirovecii (strain RU7) TaxID=1408657 RepID=A0A0W4ZIY8_PNEJ7|nr:uncharacterized protein T551_02754 [Pneumocystis jirovecii RU7]KTW28335.1 hypothetical protein T551_02754 [Pneumocystis jirovecii RU7]
MTENEDINSNLFIHMNIPETKAETIFGNITGEYASNRRYASGDTLEEPIYTAIYNDIKMIGIKLNYTLWPRNNYNILNNWDLWGPLIFCLILSSCLSLTAPKSESTIIFTSIFCVVWISELIIALNLKLLGAPISLFQSISVLGYSLFPFVIITITNLFINTVFIKFPLIIIAYTWSTYASLSVIRNFSLTKKRLLAIYPLFLYYFFIAWIIFLQSI